MLPTGAVVSDYDDSLNDELEMHIGLRSGAGSYCWDCKMTLCRGGESKIHDGGVPFYDSCPSCGKAKHSVESVAATADDYHYTESGIGGRSIFMKNTGVSFACSFTWAKDPKIVHAICGARSDDEIIEDEYGEPYTGKAFLEMLRKMCPINFYDSIGSRFS